MTMEDMISVRLLWCRAPRSGASAFRFSPVPVRDLLLGSRQLVMNATSQGRKRRAVAATNSVFRDTGAVDGVA